MRHRRLFIEQRGEVATLIAKHLDVTGRAAKHVLDIPRRLLLWAAQKITLNQIDAHFGQHRELLRQFDPFGDHLRARGPGDLQD